MQILNVLASEAADQPVQLEPAEPSGLLGSGFFLGRPGGFRITVGEAGSTPANSAAISQSGSGSSMISITFAFTAVNGPKQSGWSETYQTNDTSLGDATTMVNRYDGFINARLNMLAAGVRCTAIRFVDQVVGIPPATPTSRRVVVASGPAPQFNTKGLPYYNTLLKNTVTDFSGTKVLQRVNTAPIGGVVYKRSIWYGGIADDNDVANLPFPTAGAWTIAYGIFQFYLTPNLGIPATVKIRDVDRAQVLVPVSSVDVTGLIYQVPPGHPFTTDGMVIQATGFQSSKGGCKPGGFYRVVQVDSTHISLRNAAASARITRLGFFRKVNFLVNDIASASFGQITQRKVGRPSDSSRGKSPRRLATRA